MHDYANLSHELHPLAQMDGKAFFLFLKYMCIMV